MFCSSAVARHGIPNHEAIAAAKAGIQGKWLHPGATPGPTFASCCCLLADHFLAFPVVTTLARNGAQAAVWTRTMGMADGHAHDT